MNRKISNSAPSSRETASASPFFPQFARRLSAAVAVRARFPLPPIGAVGDPYLLDRLQSPLRRYRD